MAESEDVDVLKRRGRRRLVGAVALVLAAVIVLPMVFDSEPRQSPPAVSVRIPAQEDSGFKPKVTPKTPVAPLEPAKPEAAPIPKAPERPTAGTVEKPSPKAAGMPAGKAPEQPADTSGAERARAEAALAGGEQFVVQVGAFKDSAKVKEVTGKLSAAKLPHYTEPVAITGGTATRVRVGPYPNRDAAERILKKLQDLGLKGSKVVSQS
jgi:DedD protein